MIDTSVRWTAADGPYLLVGDVVIQNGAVLAIDAGVIVYMGNNASLTVRGGGIQAAGSGANPIRIRSERSRLGAGAAPGDWRQWVFAEGTVDTRLDHVQFEHGSGIVVHGCAPVFNYLRIDHQQGAAITVDLAASPTGVGNRASGNTLNGISVPEGEILGSVRWGLRGIPYVVGSGTLSVGKAPAIQAVTPVAAEQGQTLDLMVTGIRLGGAASASFDRAGLSLQVLAGGSDSQARLRLTVDPATAPGPANLHL